MTTTQPSLKNYRGCDETKGDFVDPDGNILGQHAGYENFTVGQRKGLGIAFGEPRFVLSVNASTRRSFLALAKTSPLRPSESIS